MRSGWPSTIEGGSVAARVKALLLRRARSRTTSMDTDLLPGLPAEQEPSCAILQLSSVLWRTASWKVSHDD